LLEIGENPSKYYNDNLIPGFSLLDPMRQADVTRLVFSSTAAVYGEPQKQPDEEGEPIEPPTPYGETTLAFERALRWYARAYGISSIAVKCVATSARRRRSPSSKRRR
jgi:UDP-glucose 4-epimerase